MPTYAFRNKDTGEEFEKFMSISAREEYLKENTNIETIICAPAVVDPATIGVQKPPSDFQKYVIDGIQRRNPGASGSKKYSIPKEW